MKGVHDFVFVALSSVALIRNASGALVDARETTTVYTSANAWDTRTSGTGCSPSGCLPELTRDRSQDDASRWSCQGDLAGGDPCKITYEFEEDQDIVEIRIAFRYGDQRTRQLLISLDGEQETTITSSGETSDYQTFVLNTEETGEISLEAVGIDGDEWVSLIEVMIMVEGDDYVELGCFKDTRRDRVLVFGTTSSSLTPDLCADRCEGYTYFGTQYGNECWCGLSGIDYDRHGLGTCDEPCAGDSSTICGGHYAFNLYEFAAITSAPITPAPVTLYTAPPTDIASPTHTPYPTTPPTPTTTPHPATTPSPTNVACSPNPCQNGGACSVDPAGGHCCSCPSGYGGMACQIDTSSLAEFFITVDFIGNWTDSQREITQSAADRWAEVITHVPCSPTGELVITSEVIDIDGYYGTWARAGPRGVWDACPTISFSGAMYYDIADIDLMESVGVLEGVVIHEMGHAIGIGTFWDDCSSCYIDGSADWTCPAAIEAYNDLLNNPGGTLADIVENDYASGSRCSHLDETIFVDEVMTPFFSVSSAPTPLSKMTAATLDDIGYVVAACMVDEYVLPALRDTGAGASEIEDEVLVEDDEMEEVVIERIDADGNVVGTMVLHDARLRL